MNVIIERRLVRLLRSVAVATSTRRTSLLESMLLRAFLGLPAFDPPTQDLVAFLKALARDGSAPAGLEAPPKGTRRKPDLERQSIALDRDLALTLKGIARARRVTMGAILDRVLDASFSGRQSFSQAGLRRIAEIAEKEKLDLESLRRSAKERWMAEPGLAESPAPVRVSPGVAPKR